MAEYVSIHDGREADKGMKNTETKIGQERKNSRKVKGRQNIRLVRRK